MSAMVPSPSPSAKTGNHPGHIKLSRKLFTSELWLEKRVWSRAEAWIDLIQTAQWQDRVYHTKLYGEIELKRGEIVCSERRLSKRWNWSRTKVRAFLESNQQKNRVQYQRKNRAGSVYLVVNYDGYQGEVSKKSRGKDQQQDQARDLEQAVNSPKQVILPIGGAGAGAPEVAVSEHSVPEKPAVPAPTPKAPSQSSLDRLPKSIVDQCLVNWGRIGGVNYGRLRKALMECVNVGIKAEDLPNAVDAFVDWFDGQPERDKKFDGTPERFAQQAAYFAKLGKLDYYDDKNELTARGALLYRGIPA